MEALRIPHPSSQKLHEIAVIQSYPFSREHIHYPCGSSKPLHGNRARSLTPCREAMSRWQLQGAAPEVQGEANLAQRIRFARLIDI